MRCVYAMAHRIEALVEAREASGSSAVDRRLMAEKRDWHRTMHDWLRMGAESEEAETMLDGLQTRLSELETRIDAAFDKLGDEDLSADDYENFFQRLGNYRGLSEAAADYARVAATIDWPRWRETRF